MIVAGCDIGSLTAKAVIMNNGEIVASAVTRASVKPQESAQEVISMALSRAGLSKSDVACTVGTGYGKKQVAFAEGTESEIACHARGAMWQVPSARTVIDIGGQDAKAIKMDADGNVIRYVYNDKCAAGTGRFLEVIAEALDLRLEDLGEISSRSKNRLTLSNQCVVFAETEIISLINEGKEIPDIISALHTAVANRAASLARGIGIESDAVMTGGVAINGGMFTALGQALGVQLKSVQEPQINGAIGAALFAMDRMKAQV